MKLISIIVPVYNLERYIERTLDSIFSQTYENIEVVAVDDGSNDGSASILDNYAKKEERLKIIHKENGGVTEARLSGIRNASGDYIGFVDGDDTVEPDMFERLLNNIVKYDADISHCGYKQIKNDKIKYFYNTGKTVTQDNECGVRDLLKGEFVEPGLWNKLFGKRLFDCLSDSTVIFDTSIKNNEDLMMNYFLFKNSERSVYEDFCPYNYIVRENSASKGTVNIHKLADPVRATKIILDDSVRINKYTSPAAEIYAVKLINAVSFSPKVRDKEIYRIIKHLRKELKTFIKCKEFESIRSNKLKVQAIFAGYLPDIYKWVHTIYNRFR